MPPLILVKVKSFSVLDFRSRAYFHRLTNELVPVADWWSIEKLTKNSQTGNAKMCELGRGGFTSFSRGFRSLTYSHMLTLSEVGVDHENMVVWLLSNIGQPSEPIAQRQNRNK